MSALPNTTTSGFTPKCSIDHSLPVEEAHLDLVHHEQDAVLVQHALQAVKKFGGGMT